MNRRPVLILVTFAALSGGACSPPDDQRTDTVDPTTAGRVELSEEARRQLEVGNEHFRAGDYEAALGEYRAVVETAPDSPTGWFGVYMALEALGRTEAADSALERAQSLAPGASLIRDTLPDGGMP